MDKENKKELPPVNITIGVYWYEDDDGSIVFDEEEMRKEFETKLEAIQITWGDK